MTKWIVRISSIGGLYSLSERRVGYQMMFDTLKEARKEFPTMKLAAFKKITFKL